MDKATCIDGEENFQESGFGRVQEGSSPGTGEPGDRFAALRWRCASGKAGATKSIAQVPTRISQYPQGALA
jgi:hypothetical protein